MTWADGAIIGVSCLMVGLIIGLTARIGRSNKSTSGESSPQKESNSQPKKQKCPRDPSDLKFVKAQVLNPGTGESLILVRDKHGQDWEFRGCSTVWHHVPGGQRAGDLWNMETVFLEHILSEFWTANVKWVHMRLAGTR